MRISGHNILNGEPVELHKEYIHRWTDVYRKGVLSKFYQLEEWYNENPRPVTLMTLSGYQGGGYTRRTKPWLKDAGQLSRAVVGHEVGLEESFRRLQDASKKLFKILRKEIPGLTYVWIIEPHKSGFPHYHVMLFHEISESLQDKIRLLWSEKYQAGSFDKGVDFSVRPVNESIKSLRNYLMKYVSKGFRSSGSRYPGDGWSPEVLCFNAVVWKNRFRMFGCSRNLSAVMAYRGDNNGELVIWDKMQVGNQYGDYYDPVWEKTEDEVKKVRVDRASRLLG